MPKSHLPTAELRVLLVDDSQMILTMMSNLLAQFGFRNVTSVDSVKGAIDRIPLLDKFPFDLVFLDFYLRDGSGLEVLKAIRLKEKELPIIMLTQEHEAKTVVEIIAEGASDYIVKPFTEELVLKKLEHAIGRTL